MLTVVALIHVIVCFLVIGLVLLQDPKNSGGGGVFGGGGSSSSLLGATGAVTFLTRLTRYTAILFGVTCLILTLLSKPNTGSVIDSMPVPANGPANAPTGNGLNGAAPVPGAPGTAASGSGATGGAAAPAPKEENGAGTSGEAPGGSSDSANGPKK